MIRRRKTKIAGFYSRQYRAIAKRNDKETRVNPNRSRALISRVGDLRLGWWRWPRTLRAFLRALCQYKPGAMAVLHRWRLEYLRRLNLAQLERCQKRMDEEGNARVQLFRERFQIYPRDPIALTSDPGLQRVRDFINRVNQ